VIQDQQLTEAKLINIQALYQVYAGMMLGYIFEIVKDKEIAEGYLLNVFGSISKQLDQINWNSNNTWYHLRQLAKNELADFNDAVNGCEATPPPRSIVHNLTNKYFDQMNDEQRYIFCSFYHHKKNIGQLSQELNKTEDAIRKVLKSAFQIIRQSYDN